MIDPVIQEHLDYIQHDLESLKNNKFTGNIEFKINMKEGGIANMNCSKHKSVKLSK